MNLFFLLSRISICIASTLLFGQNMLFARTNTFVGKENVKPQIVSFPPLLLSKANNKNYHEPLANRQKQNTASNNLTDDKKHNAAISPKKAVILPNAEEIRKYLNIFKIHREALDKLKVIAKKDSADSPMKKLLGEMEELIELANIMLHDYVQTPPDQNRHNPFTDVDAVVGKALAKLLKKLTPLQDKYLKAQVPTPSLIRKGSVKLQPISTTRVLIHQPNNSSLPRISS